MQRWILVMAALAVAHAAQAVEVGDVIWLSSNGVSLTVTQTRRVNRETVSLTEKQMATNGSEYCERYAQLTSESPKWKKCVKDGTSDTSTTIAGQASAPSWNHLDPGHSTLSRTGSKRRRTTHHKLHIPFFSLVPPLQVLDPLASRVSLCRSPYRRIKRSSFHERPM